MATDPIRRAQSDSGGYIALISTIIISLILLGLSFEMSSSGFMSRFNVLNSEYKRISLGLAESCVNAALLNIAHNYDYAGPETVSVGAQNCRIQSVTYAAPVNHRKVATITAQGEFRGAFSNMQVSATVRDPAYAPIIPATLVVVTHVINNNGGTKQAGNFNITVTGPAATPNAFAGAETGTVVTMNPGAFSVAEAAMVGYTLGTSGCSGTILAGQTLTCAIVNYDSPTTATLTVIANVKNDNGGTKQPGNFTLSISSIGPVASGIATQLAPGTYTVSGAGDPGYTASVWGYNCASNGDITLAVGNNKTCIINYDDVAPPTPACADTVMMMDRTNSTSGFQADMAKAAKALLVLYGKLSPAPQVGVGTYGALYGDPHFAQVPTGLSPQLVSGLLTSDYGSEVSAGSVTKDTSNLAPTGEGNYKQWTKNGTANAKDAVLNNDGDTTYLSESTTGDSHTFKISNAGLPAGSAVNAVTLYAVVAKTSAVANPTIKLRIEKGTGAGDLQDDPTSYVLTDTNYSLKSWSMAKNPFTNAQWTLSEVNAWTTRFGIVKTTTSGTAKVTQLYVVVNYTDPGAFTSTGLYKTINEIYGNGTSGGGTSNLSDGVTVAGNELSRTTPINGSNGHDLTKKKVMIFVADGKPDYPDNSITRLLNESDKAKKGPDNVAGNFDDAKVFSIYFGKYKDDVTEKAQRDIMAQVSSGTMIVSGHEPGSENQHGASNIQADIDDENADDDYFFIAPSAAVMDKIFTTIGMKVCSATSFTPPTLPTNANLIIINHLFNDNGGINLAADFTMNVTAVNPSQSSFAGAEYPGVTVQIDPGNYSVDATALSGYTKIIGAGCAGTVVAGDTLTCIITNDDLPPPPPPILLPPPSPNIGINSWQEQPASP